MALEPTDKYLVERDETLYSIQHNSLMSKMEDDDLLVVGRGDQNYHVAWGEIKDDIKPALFLDVSVTPVDCKTGDTLTAVANVVGGIPPYTLTYQWYNRLGTITGNTPIPGATNETFVIPDEKAGYTFYCNVTAEDSTGDTLLKKSNETLPAGQAQEPPVLDSISLTEQNPNVAPRFTDQKFDVAVTMSDDGEPGSTKTIDAYVEGQITSIKKFDEPLESTSTSGLSYEEGFTYSTAGSTAAVTEAGTPDKMFNGTINSGDSYGYYTTSASTCVFRVTPPTDADWIEGPCYIGVQVYANSRWAVGNVRPSIDSNVGNGTLVNNTSVSNGNFWVEVPAGQKLEYLEVRCPQTPGISSSFSQIAGFWRFDSQPVAGDFTAGNALTNIPERTDLVFAAGTDMSLLEAGDTVTQDGPITGTVESVNSTTVTLTEEVDGWEDGVNVIGPEKTIVEENARKYLVFGQDSQVTDLRDTPQDPPYTTSDPTPNLPLRFPSTFPSGLTPDEELGDGTVLTVSATAENGAGSSGPVTATVQPDAIPPSTQFREPLESSSVSSITETWSNYLSAISQSDETQPGTGTVLNPERAFNGANASYCTLTSPNSDDLLWDCSSLNIYPTTILFYATFGNRRNYFHFSDGSVYFMNESGEAPSGAKYLEVPVPTGAKLEKVICKSQGIFAAISIDGTILTNNQPLPGTTDLVFASGADMAPLAPGDEVTQGIGVIYDDRIANPQNIVDGNLDTFGSLSSNLYSIVLDLENPLPTGDVENSVYLKYSTSSSITCIVSIYDENNDRIGPDKTINGTGGAAFSQNFTDEVFKNKLVKRITFAPQNQTANVYGVRIGGVLIEAGVSGTVSSINGTTVSLTEKVDGWVNGEDVVGPDKTPIRSMTEAELAEQRLKFLTYENRKHVQCGEQAQADRDALITAMAEQGYDLDDILKYL